MPNKPDADGSPAHAGIDPWTGWARDRSVRFPRTRGDRPPADSRLERGDRVPPHTRG